MTLVDTGPETMTGGRWKRVQRPLESLAGEGELRAFRHTGFWQAMDTLRDRTTLEALWSSGAAPWKLWKD